MQIAGLSLAVPSLRFTNDEIVAKVRRDSTLADPCDLDRYCTRLATALARSGAGTRFVRDRARGETAIGLTTQAAREALAQAGLQPGDIDLVIYCGVGRGFIEPANAAFICRSLGMDCNNFDVADACMGWLRAMSIAAAFLQAGSHSRIMVVNAEFNATDHRMRRLFCDHDLAGFEHTFPAYSIGEAATATILVPSSTEWRFHFRNFPDLAPLCTIPTADFADYLVDDARSGLNGVDQLTSFGTALVRRGAVELVRLARDLGIERDRHGLWIPHAASASLCAYTAGKLGLADRVYNRVYPELGNVVSASLPAGLFMALGDGRVRAGDEIAFCPASAGMSVAIATGRL